MTFEEENKNTVREIAEEIEKISRGEMYTCPHCGDLCDSDASCTEDGGLVCPACGATLTPEEIQENEQTFDEYFSEVFDIEYRLDARLRYRSVRLMIACGGPNIYVDTAKREVQLYWGSDTATRRIDDCAVEQIDDVFEELYEASAN